MFADNDDVFFGNGTAAQWGYFLLHGSIYGYVSSVFVISVKVGGVVWKFLHNPVQRGLCRAKCNKKVDFFGVSKMRYRD